MEKAVFDVTPGHIVHLGDKIRDSQALQEKFCRIPFTSVPGNCDLAAQEQPVRVEEIGGVRFLITHGHLHGVKGGMLRLAMAAKEAQTQAALFGHTHIACHEEVGGIHYINPGAAGGGRPSYGVVEAENGKIVSCRIVYL